MIQMLRVVRAGAVQGFVELRMTYTWRTWTGGWLVRLLTQVAFFGMLGRLIGSPAQTRYIVVGNAVALMSIEACIVIRSMCNERNRGTLPLMIAAPTSHLPVYFGRGLQWLCTGLASSSIALLTMPRVLSVPIPLVGVLRAIPMVALVGLATYCYGCLLGAIAMRLMRLQWLVLNLGYLVLLTICGVNVDVHFWPLPLRALADVLPLTHGLAAIRTELASGPAHVVLGQLALEALVGVGWLLVAGLSCQRLVTHGRVDGSIEFG